jgi:NAD(P)-dependent dehydrogenase (short-subunit alcohol dehydrogenase family)
MSESGASECQSSATSPDLASKVAVVTGGSSGLGAATAMDLVANRVSVAVTTELTSRFDAQHLLGNIKPKLLNFSPKEAERRGPTTATPRSPTFLQPDLSVDI